MKQQQHYYTIFADNQPIGGEFGTSERDAIKTYAQGSVFSIDRLKAIRGTHTELPETANA